MRGLKLRYLYKVMLLLLILSVPYLSLIPHATAVAENPTVWLNPSFVYGYLPGDTFELEIRIGYDTDDTTWVLDLFTLDVEVSFRKSLEVLRVVDITEGDFLTQGGQTTSFTTYIDQTGGVAKASATRLAGVGGADGYGWLATIRFTVVGGGDSQLDIVGTILKDSDQNFITNVVTVNSFFMGMAPYAFFSYWPNATVVGGYSPAANQTVTFDASASIDTDGVIEQYEWDFDDETTETSANPVTTHSFKQPREYRVNLTVTDNAGYKDSRDLAITVVIRDIAVIGITVFPTGQIKAGTPLVVNVTVKNFGTLRDAYNATAYANSTIIGSEVLRSLDGDRNETLTFSWNTTGVSTGQYTVKANVTLARAEIGENNLTNNELVYGSVTIAELSRLTFQVTVFGASFYVGVETNSEVLSNFAFSHPLKQISFDVTGSSGKLSYSNVTIPMILLNASLPSAWTVKLNGTVTSYTATSNGTHYFLYFSYTFASAYEAKIVGTWVNSPPQVIFTTSATTVQLGDAVSFNATGSSDPDPEGKIVRYFFEFDDGANATGTPNYDIAQQLINYTWVYIKEGTTLRFNTTQPVIEHIYLLERYGTSGGYIVRLTLTDKDGLQNSTTARVDIYGKYDLALSNISLNATTLNIEQSLSVSVTISCREVPGAGLTADLILLGNGTVLTQRSVNIGFSSAGASRIEELVWNTAGASLGVYKLSVRVNVTNIGVILVSDYPFPEVETSENVRTTDDARVKKWDSRLAITVSPSSFDLGSFAKMTGTLSTSRGVVAGAQVTIESRFGAADWVILTTLNTSSQGLYLYTWTPTSAGTYQIRAKWLGTAVVSQNETLVQTITVKQQLSEIMLDVSETSASIGSSVSITGTVTPGAGGLSVTIRARRDGGDWTTVATVETDSQGAYSYEWTPTDAGTYEIRALWQGNVNTSGDESQSKTVEVKSGGIPEVYIYIGVAAIIVVVAAAALYFLRKR